MIPGNPYKVLAVDDDFQNLLLLKQILKNQSYNILVASSGKDALDKVFSDQPDLILLDIMMPEMDGIEVCKTLKNDLRTRHIPIMFITALRDIHEMVKGFEAGAVDYITKPFNKQELTVRVKTHLELKRSSDIISGQNTMLKQEIDQRRQTEEKFKALSQAAFEAILFVKNEVIIEVNDATRHVFMHEPAQIIGLPASKLVPPEGIKALKKIFQSSDSRPCEMEFVRQDETHFSGLLKHQRFIYRSQQINVLAISDITRLKDLEKEVRNAIIETEERERKRFAMDVHDGLGAILSSLKIYINLLQKEEKSTSERELLFSEIKTNIGEAVAAAKRIANNLMPSVLNDYGLLPALEVFSQSVMRSGAVVIHLGGDRKIQRLEKNIEINIYRICTELINNTLKHAGAENIYIDLKCGKQKLELNYLDDGKGFDFEKAITNSTQSHGLKNLVTRIQFLNGKMLPASKTETGAFFSFEIPLN